MPQPLKKPGEGGNVKVIAEGAFARLVTVTGIIDKSSYPGHEAHYYKSGNQTELYLIVSIDVDGYDKEVHLMGKFKRNKENLPVSWLDFGNSVQRFLYLISPGEIMIEDDLSVQRKYLQEIIGQKMQIITYQTCRTYTDKNSGAEKYSWDTYSKVFKDDATIEEMQTTFAEDVNYLMEKRGYDPELYRKLKTEKEKNKEKFEYGANVESESDNIDKTDVSVPDPNNDDLPF